MKLIELFSRYIQCEKDLQNLRLEAELKQKEVGAEMRKMHIQIEKFETPHFNFEAIEEILKTEVCEDKQNVMTCGTTTYAKLLIDRSPLIYKYKWAFFSNETFQWTYVSLLPNVKVEYLTDKEIEDCLIYLKILNKQ